MTEEEIQTEKKEQSVKELLNEIKEAVKKPEKTKGFKLPFGARVGNGKLKKNWATFIVIGENKEISFVKKQIDEGVIEVNDSIYTAMADYAMTYKGKPVYIIPSWSITPFNPQKDINDAEQQKRVNLGYKLLLNKIRKEAIQPKKGGGSWIVWALIGLAAVAAFYFISTSNFKLF